MSEFKSCPVCQEQSDQCLPCGSYVVDGERIYYEKLKDFGATKDHEVRFIDRIQKQRTTAFFHNGKLYIPSRQGRSVPLAIGLQWDAWQEQQAKIDELQRRNQMLNDNIKEQGQKLVYQNEVIETQSEKLLGLRDEKAELQKRVDAVKGLAQTLWEKSEEKHQQGKVWESKTLGECADEILDVLEQALKGGSND